MLVGKKIFERKGVINLQDFISSPLFYNLLIPIFGTFFIVFVKLASKTDVDLRTIKREDFAVGFDLAVAAITYFAVETAKLLSILAKGNYNSSLDIQNNLFMNVWVLLGLFVTLWFISTIVRIFGWNNDRQLKIWIGIVIPNIYGTLCLIVVVGLIGG